jgi:glutathione S-transferase
MSLTLHFHPLSSFCHKALIALYENDTPFERRIVNLMDPADAAVFKKLWPCGKFPVLQDGNRMIPESSIIIEHLDLQHPGKTRFIPADPKFALQVRLKDRFYDLHVHDHMQKVVGDRLRPEGQKDSHGVENARKRLMVSLDMIDAEMAEKTMGHGRRLHHGRLRRGAAAVLHRQDVSARRLAPECGALSRPPAGRPSYARVIEEAKPYFSMLPI